jgi:flagellar biosynthetic protein FliP
MTQGLISSRMGARRPRLGKGLLLLMCLLMPVSVWAETKGLPMMSVGPGDKGGQEYSVSIQLLAIMTMLTLLPAILLGMTAFPRIIIVLALLRTALGTGQTPSNQILLSAALFLTLFIMYPIMEKVHEQAVVPYMEEKLAFEPALAKAAEPMRGFMLAQTREDDIALFAGIAKLDNFQTPADVPFPVLAAAFLTSELKTAFQIGFLLFIPFVVIDLVVASVLMAMGMMMLSPMIVSLPFKIMLFVLVDGWALLMGSLAASFQS